MEWLIVLQFVNGKYSVLTEITQNSIFAENNNSKKGNSHSELAKNLHTFKVVTYLKSRDASLRSA